MTLHFLQTGREMSDVSTIDEIRSQYGSEWILLDDPVTDATLEVRAGKVLCHSEDRDKVYRRAVELKPKRFATLYTGKMPENRAIIL